MAQVIHLSGGKPRAQGLGRVDVSCSPRPPPVRRLPPPIPVIFVLSLDLSGGASPARWASVVPVPIPPVTPAFVPPLSIAIPPPSPVAPPVPIPAKAQINNPVQKQASINGSEVPTCRRAGSPSPGHFHRACCGPLHHSSVSSLRRPASPIACAPLMMSEFSPPRLRGRTANCDCLPACAFVCIVVFSCCERGARLFFSQAEGKRKRRRQRDG
jgi:hypothetical protein